KLLLRDWRLLQQYLPLADSCTATNSTNRKTASRRSLRNRIRCFDQAASAFRFLRQPSRPNAPRPEAKSGRAAGRGVAPTALLVVIAARKASPFPRTVSPT